jgi:hypothetical protein
MKQLSWHVMPAQGGCKSHDMPSTTVALPIKREHPHLIPRSNAMQCEREGSHKLSLPIVGYHFQ